ncbi:hypothetical protein SAMN05660235_01730 [Sporolituus thermophilus DSM 23256]|uniref:Uncharacterized protein n=1 Tax=Sporolituus thermophilus DSM 23256 TaxID=1123285 RepID=A0A1G7LFC5_9FIRM|nr:hypothetical protein SAMN05660235_01730 [Sporolituus thermophilus DSM 23256]
MGNVVSPRAVGLAPITNGLETTAPLLRYAPMEGKNRILDKSISIAYVILHCQDIHQAAL